jgi:hypothetical protein
MEKSVQLGNEFQGKKCACCHRTIHSDPTYQNNEWYHRICYTHTLQQHEIIGHVLRRGPEEERGVPAA